jgi:hypothetical protein
MLARKTNQLSGLNFRVSIHFILTNRVRVFLNVVKQGCPHMRPSKKVFAALNHQNSSSNTIQQTQYNIPTEHNMANILAEKMFRNCTTHNFQESKQ